MLTDPATEIYELCETLISAKVGGKQETKEALAKIFQCESSQDALFFELLAALKRRFDDLESAVRNSTAVPENLHAPSVEAIAHLKDFFSTDAFHEHWEQRKNKVFVNEHLTAVKFLGGYIRAENPLKKLSRTERLELIHEIEFLLVSIKDEVGVSIVGGMVVLILESVLAILERLEFFGIDAFAEKLLLAFTQLAVVENNAEAEAEADKNAIKKAYGALAMVATAIILTSGALDGTINIYNKVQAALEYLNERLPVETKLLPAPENTGHQAEPANEDDDLASPG